VLRDFFEVDRRHIALAALAALARTGTVAAALPGEAIARYRIDTTDVPPWQR
jgi:pyruvate dehydrogenase E1 component